MICLYTEAEIIAGIKQAVEDQSDLSIEHELDTGQSRHKFKRSPAMAKKNLSFWKDMLYQRYPATYRSYFGSNVMRVTSPRV